MICSSAGISASPPSRPKRLVPVNLVSQNFSKPSDLDQLVEDRALALAREGDLLVGALDALLDPALLVGIRDVHELDAERLAVGALTDRDDLAQRGEFEPQHVIEEDLAVEVGLGEAVGARIELLVVLARLEAERIEIGVEVAADAIGADQHQRAHRVARRLLHIGRRQLDAGALRLRAHLVADLLLGLGPLAVERRERVVALDERRLLPRGAARALGDVGGVVLQAAEEVAPLGIDRVRIGLEAGVEVFDVGGVAAVKKGGKRESRVGVLARHLPHPKVRRRCTPANRPRSAPNLPGPRRAEACTLFKRRIWQLKEQEVNSISTLLV